jgi:lipoate-protein ligase A
LNAEHRTSNLPGKREATAFDVQSSMLDVRCSPNPQSWFFLDSGSRPPAFNMALDEALLEAMSRLGRPVLRFYGWTESAATFGYFQKYADVERATLLRPLIRRPTGGGIVPHDADWTYSLAFPPGHEWHSLKAEESYRRVHEWIQSAFAKLDVTTELAPPSRKSAIPPSPSASARQASIQAASKRSADGRDPQSAIGCFAGYEKFDLLWNGRKIAGAAQRRNKLGLLIQGSVQPPPGSLARTDWQKAMSDVGQVEFGVEWSDFAPDGMLRDRAESLAAQKYSQAAYNYKR